MKHFGNPLLSLAAPFLIFLAIFGFLNRQGSDRLQALPALIVGAGLIISGAMNRSIRRRNLLFAIRRTKHDE